MSRQVKQMVRTLEREHSFVNVTGKGHVKMRSPKGELFVLPSTPSDHRAMKNACAMLRRAGYPVKF